MTDPARYADARDRYLACDETEQGSHWDRGAIVFDLLRDSAREAPNPRVAKRLRASIVRDFAGHVGRTRTSVNQHLDVFVAFGVEDIRAQAQCWFWHLTALRAARRLKLSPRDILELAEKDGLDAAGLNALGRVEHVQAECRGTCPDCGAKVAITVPGDRVTVATLALTLRCPCCTAEQLRDGGDALVSPRIGQLEGCSAKQTEAA